MSLEAALEQRFAASSTAAEEFFAGSVEALARACLDMARRFTRGGRLLAFGSASDAAHVAVEFMHPVIAGKRALPAFFLEPGAWEHEIRTLGRPEDIALALAGGPDPELSRALQAARELGLLTVALGQAGHLAADYTFPVPGHDAAVLQEVCEMAYHVLWELVHLFFDHLEEP
ncbi:MAG TPA: phosphoheptose isomerase [Candidatus Nitrosotenuis sp.]|nr:phosphoheptose isomerase [Candidatus Nitrosotenuis sp.]